MIRPHVLILTLIVFLLSFGISSAEIFSWEDENGVVHYSDTPPSHINEWEEKEEATGNESQQDDQTRKYEYNPELISEILDELEDGSVDDSKPAPSVELYVTSWCTYCHKAKAFFHSRGIEFTEYDIERDEAAAQRMLSFTKSRAVPLAIINGQLIQGYSIAAYERALNM
jgi:glutaredoxin-like YruB-family protein